MNTGRSFGLKRPALTEGRRVGALAMKVGMLPIYDSWGVRHPCTALHFDECQVIQTKTVESNGYTAIQLGVGEAKLKRVKKPQMGHFKVAGVKPKREVAEFRVTPDALLEPGMFINAVHFVPGQLVDVIGITKGKGFQGVMKRYGFSGGRATHGNSLSHRTIGSAGMCQDPGRVLKGKKMPGRMGGGQKTTQNLKVIKIDPVRNILFVRGAVPGNNGGFVKIRDAVKGPFFPSPPPFPTAVGEKYDTLVEDLFAPASETDPGIFKTPEDQLL